jgi:two-component system, cell cycle sensor histidine kinase and response regulator CckA
MKFLIADDSKDDARLIVHNIKRAGFAIEWIRVEREQDFARELETADFVICDYSMPQFSPARALEQIEQSGRTTPLLLVSGSVSPTDAAAIIARGAVGYLLKDNLDQIGAAITRALASSA